MHFASCSDNRKQGETAAVFIFDLQNFLTNKTMLILPPPIVERLYLQRGAFFAFPEQNISHIQETRIRLSFPFDPTFQLIRNNTSESIQTNGKWLQQVVKWSKQWAASGKPLPNSETEIQKLLITVFEQIGYPNIPNPALFLAHWLDNFEDTIYWYGTRIQGCSKYLLSGVCSNIARNNPELVQFAIQLYHEDIQRLERAGAPVLKVQSKKNLHDTWLKIIKCL